MFNTRLFTCYLLYFFIDILCTFNTGCIGKLCHRNTVTLVFSWYKSCRDSIKQVYKQNS